MEEDIEVLFQVGVAVGVVGAEAHTGEMTGGGIVEAGGQAVGPGVATGGVGAPAAGVHPAVAVAGGVDVDGNEDDVVFAEAAVPVVHAAAALLQGDVFLLGDEEFGIMALGGQGRDDAAGNAAGISVFEEAAAGAALAGSFTAVAVIDEDFHSWSCVQVYTFKLHKISEKSKNKCLNQFDF